MCFRTSPLQSPPKEESTDGLSHGGPTDNCNLCQVIDGSQAVWFDTGEIHQYCMDAIDFMPGPDWTPQQDSQFIDLTMREYMISLHESLAKSWEDGQTRLDDLTAQQLAHHQWLEQTYIEDIGVHPRHREVLKAELVKAIADSSRRSLAEVLETVSTQVSVIEDRLVTVVDVGADDIVTGNADRGLGK